MSWDDPTLPPLTPAAIKLYEELRAEYDVPKFCPKCESRRVVPVVEGMPGPVLRELAEAKMIVTTGCMVDELLDAWRCLKCDGLQK